MGIKKKLIFTDQSSLLVDEVVLATGYGTQQLLKDLPLKTLWGLSLRAEFEVPGCRAGAFFTSETGFLFIMQVSGFAGSKNFSSRSEAKSDHELTSKLLPFNDLSRFKKLKVCVGARLQTSDRKPLLGVIDRNISDIHAGVYVNTGYYKDGLTLAYLGAYYLADALAANRKVGAEIGYFSPTRFFS